MRRTLSFLVLLLFALPGLHAQKSMIELGDKVISLGLGIGNTLNPGGDGYSGGMPPFSVSIEKAIVDNIFKKGVIGIVGSLGYTSFEYRFDVYGDGWNYHNIILGAGSLFHYPLINRLDTYVGFLLGYNLSIVTEYGIPGTAAYAYPGGFVYSGFIGGRYFFTDKFAAFAQLGYGVAYLTLGVSIRL